MIGSRSAVLVGCVAAVFGACGSPSDAMRDAMADGPGHFDAATDVAIDPTHDAFDAPLDGATGGTLTPDPPDPSSLPCSGVLGFPGPASVFHLVAHELVVGDVDGDGIQDVGVNDLQVLRISRGRGDGTFEPLSSFPLPVNAAAFRLADLDGDLKPDLVFRVRGSAFTGELRVATNDGSGGFASSQVIASLTNLGAAEQLEVLDLDGDGDNDVVALMPGGPSVAVIKNNGGSFSEPQLFAVGSLQSARRMALADLSGDSKPDLVVTDIGDIQVNVLLNQGDGTFPTRVGYSTPPGPYGLVLVDVNEDGLLDVVVGSAPSYQVQLSVLLNQGGGQLGTRTDYPAGEGFFPLEMAAADIDGDGHTDLGIAATQMNRVELFLGSGTGQFAPTLSVSHNQPRTLAFADIRNNGRADLLVQSTNAVTAYLNSGTAPSFEARTTYSFGVVNALNRGARMTDLSGDGRLDLVSLGDTNNGSMGTVSTRVATGGGSFATATTSPALVASRAELADVDNDGRRDVVLLGYGSGVQTLRNVGNGSLTPIAPDTTAQAVEMAVADLDGDGWRDAAIGEFDSVEPHASRVRLRPGSGSGHFGAGSVVWTGESLNGLVAADLNGDNKQDLAIDSFLGSDRLEVLLGTGNGAFAAPIVTTSAGLPTSWLFARDLDDDGDKDVIGLDYDAIIVLLGDGSGALGDPTKLPVLGLNRRGDAAFADLDGDGNLDVVVPATSSVCVLLGHGDGTFGEPMYYEAGAQTSQITLGDVDEDGRVDILVNNDKDQVSILYGRCID